MFAISLIFLNLKKVVGNVLAVQGFELKLLAGPALVGEHSQVGKAPTSASDSGSKNCADRAFPTAFFRLKMFRSVPDECKEMMRIM